MDENQTKTDKILEQNIDNDLYDINKTNSRYLNYVWRRFDNWSDEVIGKGGDVPVYFSDKQEFVDFIRRYDSENQRPILEALNKLTYVRYQSESDVAGLTKGEVEFYNRVVDIYNRELAEERQALDQYIVKMPAYYLLPELKIGKERAENVSPETARRNLNYILRSTENMQTRERVNRYYRNYIKTIEGEFEGRNDLISRIKQAIAATDPYQLYIGVNLYEGLQINYLYDDEFTMEEKYTQIIEDLRRARKEIDVSEVF